MRKSKKLLKMVVILLLILIIVLVTIIYSRKSKNDDYQKNSFIEKVKIEDIYPKVVNDDYININEKLDIQEDENNDDIIIENDNIINAQESVDIYVPIDNQNTEQNNTMINSNIQDSNNVESNLINNSSFDNEEIDNKVNETINNSVNETKANKKLYKTVEDCNKIGETIAIKDTVDIVNTFCISVAENGELLGYELHINCNSGNCEKYMQ